MSGVDELRRALIATNPRLSKFNPLPRILAHDDFDEGARGWCELCGNHDGNLDTVRPEARDFRPPQLSSCTFFDIGTHGSMDGTYSLKLATRPQKHHTAIAIKRLTMAGRGLVQFETYFTFKTEASFDQGSYGGLAWDGNTHPSEAQFGSFTLCNDICESPDATRYHAVLRYQNTDDDGNFVQKWRYATSAEPTTKMYLRDHNNASSDFSVAHPDDWRDIPGGEQRLCHNEVPTKVNWHYLRWCFDTRTRRSVELQVNGLTMDLREIPVPVYPEPYWGIEELLNIYLTVRTNSGLRNFLYLDSALISADW